ncbi:protein pangolin, isoforms A/H/I/S-like [Centruroides sculpturatus]|uniref:protein pangolin, isoforms A/H/I/S-like n=1 Tax=Centruroides sculpturatus TaxID=218467 RepID=UPI000C6CA613|nr:protein pangolin, isoforms A/H/I/S-like [Centruroides sculpturatus]
MPHAAGGGGSDDFASDEIKVFKHEGEEEEEKKTSSENLTDLKSSLVTEGEENSSLPGQSYVNKAVVEPSRQDSSPVLGKPFEHLPHPPFGYVVSPYAHPNGTIGPVSMANKVAMVPQTHPGSPLPFMMYNSEGFTQPPPAHMGIPPVHLSSKTGEYQLNKRIVKISVLICDYVYVNIIKQIYQGEWRGINCMLNAMNFSSRQHTPMYSMTPAGFRGPYPPGIPVTTAGIPRFSAPALLPHHGLTSHPGFHHPVLLATTPKLELPIQENNSQSLASFREEQKVQPGKGNETSPRTNGSGSTQNKPLNDKKTHIKKPLNAFMLYMKEMRAKVVAECTLKESAAINQILGRRWHGLSREEQAKYYEMARKERQIHMQLYPGWSARDNYALNNKKKKRKKDKTQDGDWNTPKKCRARFGLEHQNNWCKPCRRKKKCIRYVSGNENSGECEDNLQNLEAPTPESRTSIDSDQDTLNVSSELSLSSPPVPTNSESSNLELMLPDAEGVNPSHVSQNHPLSVHLLTQPHATENCDPDSVSIPQLPTPPSTDSSTAAAPPLLTVT